jgi:hypothetical protein
VVSEVILETRELKIPNVNANDLHLYVGPSFFVYACCFLFNQWSKISIVWSILTLLERRNFLHFAWVRGKDELDCLLKDLFRSSSEIGKRKRCCMASKRRCQGGKLFLWGAGMSVFSKMAKLIAEYIPRSLEAPFCAVFGRAKLKPERVLAERKTNRKISEKESADLETIRIRAGQLRGEESVLFCC